MLANTIHPAVFIAPYLSHLWCLTLTGRTVQTQQNVGLKCPGDPCSFWLLKVSFTRPGEVLVVRSPARITFTDETPQLVPPWHIVRFRGIKHKLNCELLPKRPAWSEEDFTEEPRLKNEASIGPSGDSSVSWESNNRPSQEAPARHQTPNQPRGGWGAGLPLWCRVCEARHTEEEAAAVGVCSPPHAALEGLLFQRSSNQLGVINPFITVLQLWTWSILSAARCWIDIFHVAASLLTRLYHYGNLLQSDHRETSARCYRSLMWTKLIKYSYIYNFVMIMKNEQTSFIIIRIV